MPDPADDAARDIALKVETEQALLKRSLSPFETLLVLDLTTARAGEPHRIQGNAIHAIDASDGGANVSVRVNRQSRSVAFPLRLGDMLRTPFYEIQITHAAQAGKTITLAVGTIDERLFSYRTNRTPDGALLLDGIGAKTDAAATTDAGSFSLIALFKRWLTRWTENLLTTGGQTGAKIMVVGDGTKYIESTLADGAAPTSGKEGIPIAALDGTSGNKSKLESATTTPGASAVGLVVRNIPTGTYDTRPTVGGSQNDTFTAPATGTFISSGAATRPFKSVSAGVRQTGTVTSWTVVVEGSNDGTNYFLIQTLTNAAPGIGAAATAACNYQWVRARCTAIVLGAGTNIIVHLTASGQ